MEVSGAPRPSAPDSTAAAGALDQNIRHSLCPIKVTYNLIVAHSNKPGAAAGGALLTDES